VSSSPSAQLVNLAQWMAADFSNQAQAFANPPFFAHIRVCMRPLPFQFLGALSFYLEQAYDFSLNRPYRSRVLKLVETSAENSPSQIIIENYGIQQEEEFYGASRQPDRLRQDAREAPTGTGRVAVQTLGLDRVGVKLDRRVFVED